MHASCAEMSLSGQGQLKLIQAGLVGEYSSKWVNSSGYLLVAATGLI
jgi:hypothetical protein